MLRIDAAIFGNHKVCTQNFQSKKASSPKEGLVVWGYRKSVRLHYENVKDKLEPCVKDKREPLARLTICVCL